MSALSDPLGPRPEIELLVAFCKTHVYATSTLRDYIHVVNFLRENRQMKPLLPRLAFAVLIIECWVECTCTVEGCQLRHHRIWSSNYEFLLAEGMLSLITELRFVMNDKSQRDLCLYHALRHYNLHKTPLLNVESVTFLGDGVFTAGKTQTPVRAITEANATANYIMTLCPNLTALYYHSSDGWGSSARLHLMPVAAGTMTCMQLFGRAIDNISGAQTLTPPPESPSMEFSKDLTSLTVNLILLLPNQKLPRVLVASLRRLKITHVCKAVDWSMLGGDSGNLVFPQVEKLNVSFIDPASTLFQWPARDDFSVEFPRLHTLKVAGAKYADKNFHTYFAAHPVQLLILSVDPCDLKDMNMCLLWCTQSLQVKYCDTRESTSTMYTTTDMEALYRFKTSVEMASLSGLDYPMPKILQWPNLRWLYLTASIADIASIVRLLMQLENLNTLAIRSLSMHPADLHAESQEVHFASQAGRFERIFRDANPYADKPLCCPLQRLEISVRYRFDVISVIKLVQRLPMLKYLGLNPELVTAVAKVITPMVSPRSVVVGEFSTTELPGHCDAR